MPSHTLKMIALLVVLSVAPAAAGHQPAEVSHDRSGCPHERARVEAAARPAVPAPATQKVTTITLLDRGDGSLFGIDRGASFLRP